MNREENSRVMNINDFLKRARKKLAGISETPSLDAEWLLLDILGRNDSSWLIAHGDQELTREQEMRFTGLVERRVKGEPLAYILGWWEFYGRRLKITPDVLVPRPATEELVDKALEKILSLNKFFGRPITVADIGTGSGCIAITLAIKAQLRPFNKIIATDVSEAALTVAKENAQEHGVADKITWLLGDMLEPIKNRPIDLIVSNPPYVPSEEINRALLSPAPATAGLAFEPRAALDGGRDGMKYGRLIQESGIQYVIESVGGKILAG